MLVQGRSHQNFQRIAFLKFFLLQSDNEVVVSEMPKKKKNKTGVTVFVSKINRVEKYPGLKLLARELLARAKLLSLQGFIVKNIEAESTEENNPSHTL